MLSLQVDLAGERYADQTAARFYAEALERIRAIPGVESAAAISWRPFGVGSATRFRVPDRPAPAAGQEPVAEVRIVSPGLFRTLGIPLHEGRDFDARDSRGPPAGRDRERAVAREFWPGQSALGRRIAMEWGGPLDAEIVGVVGDARLVGLDTPARAHPLLARRPGAQPVDDVAREVVRAARARWRSPCARRWRRSIPSCRSPRSRRCET